MEMEFLMIMALCDHLEVRAEGLQSGTPGLGFY